MTVDEPARTRRRHPGSTADTCSLWASHVPRVWTRVNDVRPHGRITERFRRPKTPLHPAGRPLPPVPGNRPPFPCPHSSARGRMSHWAASHGRNRTARGILKSLLSPRVCVLRSLRVVLRFGSAFLFSTGLPIGRTKVDPSAHRRTSWWLQGRNK